jgi:hypothetical protein
MHQKYDALARKVIGIDAEKTEGTLDYERAMIGIGGANSAPVPEKARKPVADLSHRMVRVFLQEYFFIYPEHDIFDWTRLDAFMDSVAETGAKVLASICIKPHVLYPVVDPKIFMPNDDAEWQRVVRALVKRYSIDRELVTHWGILNEINIGEPGGCPHEIPDPDDYYAYYKLTSEAVIEAWPQAKVGGPSVAGFNAGYLERFIGRCTKENTQLDFISYNIYSGNPEDHANAARTAAKLASAAGAHVEIYQTELNTWFPDAYVEEAAYSGRYAASLAAVLMELNETPITGSFQFDMYDAYVDPNEFEPFYSITPFMLRHWNEIPHRFGLFDFEGNVRPQYFVYRMLQEMRGARLAVRACESEIRAAACERDGAYRMLLTNFGVQCSRDVVAELAMRGVKRGLYRLEVFRIDDARHWNADKPELIPVESRLTYALPGFSAHVLLPADSVTLVRMTPVKP